MAVHPGRPKIARDNRICVNSIPGLLPAQPGQGALLTLPADAPPVGVSLGFSDQGGERPLCTCQPQEGILTSRPGQVRLLATQVVERKGPSAPVQGRRRRTAFLPSEQRAQTLPAVWVAEQQHQTRRKEGRKAVPVGLVHQDAGTQH